VIVGVLQKISAGTAGALRQAITDLRLEGQWILAGGGAHGYLRNFSSQCFRGSAARCAEGLWPSGS